MGPGLRFLRVVLVPVTAYLSHPGLPDLLRLSGILPSLQYIVRGISIIYISTALPLYLSVILS